MTPAAFPLTFPLLTDRHALQLEKVFASMTAFEAEGVLLKSEYAALNAVVSNAIDWDIVPKYVWDEVERDICRLVASEHLDDPQGEVHEVMSRINALAEVGK